MVKRYFPVLEFFNVPNAITLSGLVMGMVNICMIFAGNLKMFYLLYFLASCFDSLDGFAAKALNQRTAIGEELDSLSDCINFSLVPALFAIGVCGFRVPIVIGAAAFAACGTLRLGYYNLIKEDTGGFVGVPTTIASMFACLFVWLFHFALPWLEVLVMPALVLLAASMICRVKIPTSNFLRLLFGFIGLGFLVIALLLHNQF